MECPHTFQQKGGNNCVKRFLSLKCRCHGRLTLLCKTLPFHNYDIMQKPCWNHLHGYLTNMCVSILGSIGIVITLHWQHTSFLVFVPEVHYWVYHLWTPWESHGLNHFSVKWQLDVSHFETRPKHHTRWSYMPWFMILMIYPVFWYQSSSNVDPGGIPTGVIPSPYPQTTTAAPVTDPSWTGRTRGIPLRDRPAGKLRAPQGPHLKDLKKRKSDPKY